MTALAYGALWVFVFTIPWERLLALPGIAIVPKVTGVIASGLALLAIVISGRFRRWHLFHFVALLFWGWAALGQLLFHSGERLPFKFWTYGQLLLVVWMTWELATTRKRIVGLLTAYVLGATVAAMDTHPALPPPGGPHAPILRRRRRRERARDDAGPRVADGVVSRERSTSDRSCAGSAGRTCRWASSRSV